MGLGLGYQAIRLSALGSLLLVIGLRAPGYQAIRLLGFWAPAIKMKGWPDFIPPPFDSITFRFLRSGRSCVGIVVVRNDGWGHEDDELGIVSRRVLRAEELSDDRELTENRIASEGAQVNLLVQAA